MELELGLSLPNYNNKKIPILLKELDLINYVNYCNSKQEYYDHNNGDNLSDLSSQSSSVNDDDNRFCKNYNSVFDEVESSQFCFTKTLPLLVWNNNQPNEDDDEQTRSCNYASITLNKNESDEVVGWPPINTHRKKYNNENHQRRGREGNILVTEHGGGCGGSRSSLYVKVQMQGCFITRKVDLKLHHSYEDLTFTLLRMFAKGQHEMNDYKLLYQDAEGDWLLAGDLPWRTFIESVQRLKMLKRDV